MAEKDGIITGYGNIRLNGYLDHLYVHKDFQRSRIGTAICGEMERHISNCGITEVTVRSSITAKPFFENRGYRILEKNQAELENGIKLTNYLMKKELKR